MAKVGVVKSRAVIFSPVESTFASSLAMLGCAARARSRLRQRATAERSRRRYLAVSEARLSSPSTMDNESLHQQRTTPRPARESGSKALSPVTVFAAGPSTAASISVKSLAMRRTRRPLTVPSRLTLSRIVHAARRPCPRWACRRGSHVETRSPTATSHAIRFWLVATSAPTNATLAPALLAPSACRYHAGAAKQQPSRRATRERLFGLCASASAGPS